VRAPIRTRGTSFWNRSLNVLRDGDFWRQQAHVLAAWLPALAVFCVVSIGLELLSAPVWYRWSDGLDVGELIGVDSLWVALATSAAGLAVLVAAVHLLGPATWLSRWLATRLLTDESDAVRSPAETRARRLRALTVSGLIAITIVSVLIVIWAVTTRGYFWPIWPLLSLALVLAIFGWIVLVLERPAISERLYGSGTLAGHVGISSSISLFLVAVWAVTGAGYFWPVWTLGGLAFGVLVHGVVEHVRRELNRQQRIRELETTRAGAVDVQETELRRIERDLHDGAQARLVALGMSLGMAEEKLRNDPDAARALLAEARTDVREALQELRDLARGIHPPILTDRGLEAAIAALAGRSPLPVTLSVDVAERPVAAVETAAYFVVAEALANASKHANAERIDIRVWRSDGTLIAEVEDDGDGGADPSGNGLTGLKQRVGALDGTLLVESPVGGPTTVRAELPCE
jgi:signal transduction histidine kinase